jgi:hypothetical protein
LDRQNLLGKSQKIAEKEKHVSGFIRADIAPLLLALNTRNAEKQGALRA